MTQQQPYDSFMKAIFQEDAADIIQLLVPGAILTDVLSIELLRPSVRADRIYRINYRGEPHLLHLEFQAAEDKHMEQRMLVYHALLLQEYQQPIISIVIYLFRTRIPTPPLYETSGDDTILTFHYTVIPLWTLDARKYVREHARSIYALLPAMANADAHILLQAIDELIKYYKDDQRQLLQRLLWLKTFLQKARHIPKSEREKVRQRLDIFDQLLEESEFVQKQRQRGLMEGKREGKREGEVKTSQTMILDYIQIRFPALLPFAQSRITQLQQAEELHELYLQIISTPDEDAVWTFLQNHASTQQ